MKKMFAAAVLAVGAITFIGCASSHQDGVKSTYRSQWTPVAADTAKTTDAAKAAGVACQAHSVEALHPWEAIIDHAKRNECDLVVMTSHGRRGVSALLLGSETQKVLTHSTVAVLVVR